MSILKTYSGPPGPAEQRKRRGSRFEEQAPSTAGLGRAVELYIDEDSM